MGHIAGRKWEIHVNKWWIFDFTGSIRTVMYKVEITGQHYFVGSIYHYHVTDWKGVVSMFISKCYFNYLIRSHMVLLGYFLGDFDGWHWSTYNPITGRSRNRYSLFIFIQQYVYFHNPGLNKASTMSWAYLWILNGIGSISYYNTNVMWVIT